MKLPAISTFDEAATLAASLPAALAEAPAGTWRIDASALTAYDTSTISLLMQAQRLAREAGRDVLVHGAPAKLAGLAQLYGVAELLALEPSPSASSPTASAPST